MYLGDVIGRVVSTVKDPGLAGRTLLLVRRLGDGVTVVAVDAVGAGAGERVYVCRGRESSFAFLPEISPADATVVGIVDLVSFEA
jgi:ethanolamine utilization protein EutN